MTHKKRKKSRIFMFLSTGCSLLRAEGFSCSLGVLYGGLGISKLQFFIKKIEIKFPVLNFLNFRSSNPGYGSGIRIRNPDPQLEKMLDPDPDLSMRIRNPGFLYLGVFIVSIWVFKKTVFDANFESVEKVFQNIPPKNINIRYTVCAVCVRVTWFFTFYLSVQKLSATNFFPKKISRLVEVALNS
jgi:hypothetical protein